jgi:hypothetical protein
MAALLSALLSRWASCWISVRRLCLLSDSTDILNELLGASGEVDVDRCVPRSLAAFSEGCIQKGSPSGVEHLTSPGNGGWLRHDVAENLGAQQPRHREHGVALRPGVPSVVALPSVHRLTQVSPGGNPHHLFGNRL